MRLSVVFSIFFERLHALFFELLEIFQGFFVARVCVEEQFYVVHSLLSALLYLFARPSTTEKSRLLHNSRISTYYNIANIFMKGESNMPNYRYNVNYGDSMYYFKRQMVFYALGFIGMWIVYQETLLLSRA